MYNYKSHIMYLSFITPIFLSLILEHINYTDAIGPKYIFHFE